VISLGNLFAAWREFQRGKRFKEDVLEFSMDAEEHLISLHRDLTQGTYRHSAYTHFTVADPKPRDIHKASVRDRVLHHAIHRVIEPLFEKRFIYDTYSSRKGKGTHRAMERFESLAWKLCRNRTRTVWVLQCDIRKFFASLEHDILMAALGRTVKDTRLLGLLSDIITSFPAASGRGIPLGNLTSQLFANVYLDPLDQYMKRVLRVPVYLRYADDMLLAHTDKELLMEWRSSLERFLSTDRKLDLHPHKTTLRTWHQGIDFLGLVSFPTHRVLRTRTKRRMQKRLSEQNASSYLGVAMHARALLLRICSMVYSIHEGERRI
jgi:retron-type reverse transcriptase